MRNWHGNLSPFGKWHTAGGRLSPFAGLMSTLLADATQLIAHPLEYGSMFQDRAGSIPVTEPGQLVGMVLDHGFTGSKPVPTGPELSPDPSFDNPVSWNTSATVTITGGQLVAVGSAGSGDSANLVLAGDFVAGGTYQIEFDLDAPISGGSGLFIRLQFGAMVQIAPVGTPAGKHTALVTAGANSTSQIYINPRSDLVLNSLSVRELPGYHATAISDAARMVFRDVGGFRWVDYNGVNTAYSTPALPAPLVDKAQVFAGVRKLSDLSTAFVVEFSSSVGSNNGVFALVAPSSSQPTYDFRSKGTNLSLTVTPTNYEAPITNVLTGLGDISGDLLIGRIDGTQVAQSTADQGTGNYNPSGTYPIYYGARAGASLFFNGRHYATLGPITRFSAANATAAQIEAAEAYYTARVI